MRDGKGVPARSFVAWDIGPSTFGDSADWQPHTSGGWCRWNARETATPV